MVADRIVHKHISSFTQTCMKKTVPMSELVSAVIHKYLSKLSSFDDLLCTFPEKRRLVLRSNFEKSMKMYKVSPLASTSASTVIPTTQRRLKDFPKWILEKYIRGYFTPNVIEIAVEHETVLPVVPGDPTKEDTAMDASRPIRQAIYSILAGPLTTIKELHVVLCRQGLQSHSVNTVCIFNGVTLPRVQEIASQGQFDLFCAILKVDASLLKKFQQSWQFFLAVTHYWVRNTNPPRNVVKSLILCLLEDDRRLRERYCRTALSNIRTIEKLKYPQSKDEFTHICLAYCQQKVDTSVLHSCAQWQCIYLDCMNLNTLLKDPLEFVSPAFQFNGQYITFHASCTSETLDQMASHIPKCKDYVDIVDHFLVL